MDDPKMDTSSNAQHFTTGVCPLVRRPLSNCARGMDMKMRTSLCAESVIIV